MSHSALHPGPKAECYVIYGKCNLVDIRLIMASLLITI